MVEAPTTHARPDGASKTGFPVRLLPTAYVDYENALITFTTAAAICRMSSSENVG
jgi:hypothetical protein